MSTIKEDKNYVPYVSKSDRPRGRAIELKAIGLSGNVAALLEANEMLSPSQHPVNCTPKNQRQRRKFKRSNPNAR